MVYRLLAKSTSLGAIALLLTYQVSCLAAEEYVFTAPSEMDRKTEEIPASETDYPLYECEPESSTGSETDSETALDPHDCTCADCENTDAESQSEAESTPQSNSSEQ